MNENLKRILSQRAKIFIERYLKTYNKFEFDEDKWWLVKDVLTNYIEKKKLCLELKNNEIHSILENLIEYLKQTYSNKFLISRETKKYKQQYYEKKVKRGNEMTGKEIALRTAAIKREKSSKKVLDGYEKLIKLNQKPTIANILIMINNELSKAQVSRYLKEIKGKK